MRLIAKHSGHGTYVDNDEVISSVAGTVERVNKLITVRAIRTRLVGASFAWVRFDYSQGTIQKLGTLSSGVLQRYSLSVFARYSIN